MRADRIFAYGATAGLIGDLLLGDPRRGHPVAAFGRAAADVERRLWRDHRGWGALHTLVCAGGAAGGAALAARALRRHPAASVALTAAATWSVVGGTSLGREARSIGAALTAGDLELARERLPRLCGRDPQFLDGPQIARAVVESVAENTSDAVVGALVWGALGGVPGLVGFRAANTLDAMVGHKSPRYRRYGWASARLDDLAGWPGARLTALLAVAAGGGAPGARPAGGGGAGPPPRPPPGAGARDAGPGARSSCGGVTGRGGAVDSAAGSAGFGGSEGGAVGRGGTGARCASVLIRPPGPFRTARGSPAPAGPLLAACPSLYGLGRPWWERAAALAAICAKRPPTQRYSRLASCGHDCPCR
ncbi:cobalamin biosynthesis protein [Streptomyces sp. NPDC005776]|uniref:cobalamin biosynthesis protein n=1 Tax=Streptomyces sp. NPDC005776 TaxID=3154676 RepID=UPI0033C48E1C